MFLSCNFQSHSEPRQVMTIFELWILAAGLAMDSFAISVSGGILLKRPQWRIIFRSAALFGFFQMLMPVIGWAASLWLSEMIDNIDHWIALVLLAFIGVRMIYENFKASPEKRQAIDFTRTRLLMLAIATSIDALAVGVSLAFFDTDSIVALIIPVTIIGLVSFVLSIAGYICGLYFGGLKKFRPELAGGLILIGIGMKICVRHVQAFL